MIVLRIKEHSNGEVALEYRIKRKETSINMSIGEVDMISYHYVKLATFRKGSSVIIPVDNDASFDLIKTLSKVGEQHIVDFRIELAVNYDKDLEAWIASTMRLFCLSPQDVLLVSPGFN